MNPHDRYDSLFQFYGQENGVDWKLVKAQCRAESAFHPRAVSPVGASGLMQFMPATWDEWGNGGDQKNPEDSIKAGCRYMAWLLKQFNGDRFLALAAYNWGIGNVKKQNWKAGYPAIAGKVPQETSMYISRINGYYQQYLV